MTSEKVVKLKTEDISNWEFRDRQDFEMGSIDELSSSIRENGQAQPIIVVRKSIKFKSKYNENTPYVFISGYRRWLACKKLDIEIDALIRDLSVSQAIGCLVAENEKESISDYSKGVFYNGILEKEKITQKEPCSRLHLKDSTLRCYLSFNKVPDKIWREIKDLKKVSARTAAEIKFLSTKGEDYIEALILIADKISQGAGAKVIRKLAESIVAKKTIEIL